MYSEMCNQRRVTGMEGEGEGEGVLWMVLNDENIKTKTFSQC